MTAIAWGDLDFVTRTIMVRRSVCL